MLDENFPDELHGLNRIVADGGVEKRGVSPNAATLC
jgi:hypothetical protein